MIALLHAYKKNETLSHTNFDASRIETIRKLREHPDDMRFHFSLSLDYAGLGMRQDALRECDRGLALASSLPKRVRREVVAENLMRMYTLLGDRAHALVQVDSLLSASGMFCVTRLEIDPFYDSLRELPAYHEVIAKHSAEPTN
jgi:hypothetical protein